MRYRHTTSIKKVLGMLEKEYPQKRPLLYFRSAFDLLVATILSAQCTDKMVNSVAPRLFKKYKNVRDYARADTRRLMKDIRSIGLYKGKARNIKKAAHMIIDEFGGRVPNSIDKLTRLPGVGRKTANIVLAHGFGKLEGIAVDTHVARLSRRLGLTKENTPVKIELDLVRIVPKRYWGEVNTLLIRHGRAVCRARNPMHSKCVIKDYCRSYKTFVHRHCEEPAHRSRRRSNLHNRTK